MSRLFQDAGEALYGPRWQSELARQLSVSDRTVRRWVAGVDAVPPGVYADLLRLAVERAAALEELCTWLRRRDAAARAIPRR